MSFDITTTDAPGRPATGGDDHRSLARVRALSWLLDRAYLDPLLGFALPGIGDVIGAVLGTYVVGVALRLRVPPVVIARMLINLSVDAGLGLVPLVGDLGDLAFRAHRKNLALLTDRGAHLRSRPSDWFLVLGAFTLFVVLMGLVTWAAIRVVGAIF